MRESNCQLTFSDTMPRILCLSTNSKNSSPSFRSRVQLKGSMSMYCTPILNITYKSIVSLGTFHPFPFLFSLFIIQIFLNSFLLNIISFLVKRISTDTCTSYYYLINSLFKINTLNSASLFKKLGKTDSKYRIKIAQF